MSTLTLAVVGDVPQPISSGTQYDVRLILSGDDGPQPAVEMLIGEFTNGAGELVAATLQLARLVNDPDGANHSAEILTSDRPGTVIVQDAADPLLFHVTAG